MAAELKDFRGRITAESDCVLEAQSRALGVERQEIARKVLHEWAMQQIHAANVLHMQLRSEGLKGIDGGASGNLRESEGVSRSHRS
jgi:hypothetical protein